MALTALAAALSRAETDFDLAPVERLLDRWWLIATIRANHRSATTATGLGLIIYAIAGDQWVG